VSPVLAVDHVIVFVEDLDVAARRLYEDTGLGSVVGGRHPGHGTGNRIVPLGDDYLELMAVVDRDEAASSPLGSWVKRRLLEVGEGPGALCLRTDDIEAVARRTGHAPLAMSRMRPDGVELHWHLVALDAALADGLPFFIQWHVAEADHPGRERVEHRRSPVGIDWVEVGADQERIGSWLGPHELPLRLMAGAPGPHRVAVALADGESAVIG
jgi:Glyoxalase-like domain